MRGALVWHYSLGDGCLFGEECSSEGGCLFKEIQYLKSFNTFFNFHELMVCLINSRSKALNSLESILYREASKLLSLITCRSQ